VKGVWGIGGVALAACVPAAEAGRAPTIEVPSRAEAPASHPPTASPPTLAVSRRHERAHDPDPHVRDAGSVRVTITPSEVLVGGAHVAASSPPASIPEPLRSALAGAHGGRATLAVDARVPYAVLASVLSTLGALDVRDLDFLVDLGSTTGTVRARVPRASDLDLDAGGPPLYATPALPVTVVLGEEGIALRTPAGNVAPGCNRIGPGLAVPKQAGAHDFARLATCGIALKNAVKLGETVIVVAGPEEPFQSIVAAADALEDSFPSVYFDVARD
jgi:hypothetical protein